ncbi:pentapeptide repeat-containing protein [Dactylosporangium sp. NPDC005572]|uniref:pentapeptide repeat-containing protein n=1 Tax=Dactylosporangium sp. NPDC005572 TaxID=3156889 RepID=UPI0033A7A66F
MGAAQKIDELAYAAYLQAHTEPLEPDASYTEVHLDGVEADGVDAAYARFVESAFEGVTLTEGSLDHSRFSDVWVSRNRWVGVKAAEAEWLDVTVLDSVLAGVQAYGSRLRRVVFQRCKIDSLNLRGATLVDVEFDGCELNELDCAGASLTNVTFAGSAVKRARFGGVKLKKVDFRGARELDVADGADALRGAIIDERQLFDLAPALADALGIEIR